LSARYPSKTTPIVLVIEESEVYKEASFCASGKLKSENLNRKI